MSLAGAVCRTKAMGFWWVEVPKERWPQHEEWKQILNRHWHRVWSDRRQEMVFIGTGMDKIAITTALYECLLGTPGACVSTRTIIATWPIHSRAGGDA